MNHPNLTFTKHDYLQGPQATELHTLDVWRPLDPPLASKWVIYIHGGAWRDPAISSASFKPTLDILSYLVGGDRNISFASINYRLSPYPNHPTNPSSPDDPARNARHPDHVMDVARALVFMEEIYNIDTGYLLVGHSCGATLAFQIKEQYEHLRIPKPSVVLGVEGIYSLGELVKSHSNTPMYRDFVVMVFGTDENNWKNASPYSSNDLAAWLLAKAVIVAHSDEDELVEKMQAQLMLRRVQESTEFSGKSYYLSTSGRHDDIWRDGYNLARLIQQAMAIM